MGPGTAVGSVQMDLGVISRPPVMHILRAGGRAKQFRVSTVIVETCLHAT